MTERLPAILRTNLRLPVIAAPLFIVSGPDLVVAQAKSGIIGSFPALNARTPGRLREWLTRITAELGAAPEAAPYAVNLIAHKTNERLGEDLAILEEFGVPIVITSLGARPEINDRIHAYGGVVLHDVINNVHARKAIDKGADGLIAVAAGAGGHAGVVSPFALIQEIRDWFDGPLALSGSIAHGDSVLAALAAGADFAYAGSLFIATDEANAEPEYKKMIVTGTAGDIVYTDYFTGVKGNYLRPSITAAGLDPDALGAGSGSLEFLSSDGPKAWRDIWGAGHGIGAVDEVRPTAAVVDRLAEEYRLARARVAALA
ncbi:NAD(P)H-dependent flavin oxidoreductase [Nocardia carnea]|uniref:NAD(P)H-dependent flavin oxidoreductase n=1 Tax=Nocardia carnea TaxID=37328 RepID=A0ABW7TP93_9NOCA|nr:nitronate monooxygenase family protein [Nocardia carnea]